MKTIMTFATFELSDFYSFYQGFPEWKLSSMTQELGIIETRNGSLFEGVSVGQVLSLIPYHSCAAAAYYPVSKLSSLI